MKFWTQIPAKDRLEILSYACFMFVFLIVVILAIAWSRGNDVDYFKERLLIFEQRMNGMDKVIHETRDKNDRLAERQTESEMNLKKLEQRQTEDEKWIEEWKRLPSLPKPKR